MISVNIWLPNAVTLNYTQKEFILVLDTPVTYESISLLNQLILKDIGKLNMKVFGYTLGLVTSVSMLQLNNVI